MLRVVGARFPYSSTTAIPREPTYSRGRSMAPCCRIRHLGRSMFILFLAVAIPAPTQNSESQRNPGIFRYSEFWV